MNSSRENNKEFIKNNKLVLKWQQRFRSETHNVFTEEVHKTALNAHNYKRMQSIFSIETLHMALAKTYNHSQNIWD